MSQFNQSCYQPERIITLTGQVFDTVTHEILPFVNVYLSNNTEVGTAANEDGIFTIDIPSGSKLTASYVGYHAYEFTVDQGFTKVFLTPDDQLGTVYLEGENKKSNWFWWLAVGIGGIALASSNDQKASTSKKRTPIKAKI